MTAFLIGFTVGVIAALLVVYVKEYG